jgi:hypothetical protein
MNMDTPADTENETERSDPVMASRNSKVTIREVPNMTEHPDQTLCKLRLGVVWYAHAAMVCEQSKVGNLLHEFVIDSSGD